MQFNGFELKKKKNCIEKRSKCQPLVSAFEGFRDSPILEHVVRQRAVNIYRESFVEHARCHRHCHRHRVTQLVIRLS